MKIGGLIPMPYNIPSDIVTAQARVFEYVADGRKVVVKRYAKPDMIFVHIFQNALAMALREPVLRRADALGDDIYLEPKKLRILRESGLNVPKVLYECPEYFVMEHVGENLGDILGRERDEGKRDEYLTNALAQLRSLHEKNFVHGGAQIKNFTCLGGEVYMIDFEEVVPDGHTEAFKRRDLLVFAMSLRASGISNGLDWICGAYGRSGREICKELAAGLLRYKFLKFLASRAFSWISMNDVRAMISLIEDAERLKI
jgi:tRNA A-37 threonylcarbamoyl transferase component Bud32